MAPPGTRTSLDATATMQFKTVYVSNHVHWCIADKHLVFLDLRRDKYLCLDRSDTRAAASLMLGRPIATEIHGDPISIPGRPPASVIGELIDAGLLTLDNTMGREPQMLRTPSPEEELSCERRASASFTTYRQISRFLFVHVRAFLKLRLSSIESVVEGVTARKIAHGAESSQDSQAQYAVLTPTFLQHRWLIPVPYSCLFDSLALFDYLAANELLPSWIFGVRMNPFAAHCWLQHGRTVLNDSVGVVRNYTPILMI